MESTITLPGIELEPKPLAEPRPATLAAADEDLTGRERRYRPIDRGQTVMHPVDVEHLLAEDDPARHIWELLGELNLSRYRERIRAVEERAGRPPYDPRLLASLWILAYSQGISSGHEIERLCHYQPQYMWLTGCRPVSCTTLCEFRRIDPEAQRQMFAEVLGVMMDKGLVTLERAFQDGTKMQACASADTFRGQEKIEAKVIEARQWIEQLEQQAQDGEKPSPQKVAAAKRQLEKRELAREELKKLQAVKAKKNKGPESAKVSLTDPEARMMKKRHGGYEPSLNAQIVADGEQGMVVAAFLTQSASDAEALIEGIRQTETNTGSKPKQKVADGGYATNRNAAETEQMGVELYSPPGDHAARSVAACKRWKIGEAFRPEAFQYREAEDCMVCPAGKILVFGRRCADEKTGEVRYSYEAKPADCQGCPNKAQCCPLNKKGRTVSRAEMPPAMARLKARMNSEEAKAIYAKRKQVIELVNAWLKAKLGLRQFRLQGLIKNGMELLWACLAFNIRIWLRVRGTLSPAPPG